MAKDTLKYSGKPKGTLRLENGKYKTLDVKVPDPPRSARQDRMIYVNVRVNWKIKDKKHPDYYKQVANIRIRWRRNAFKGKPVDTTAYHDYTVTPIMTQFLITLVHWESGEKGRNGVWQASLVSPDATWADIYTRYSKDGVENPA